MFILNRHRWGHTFIYIGFISGLERLCAQARGAEQWHGPERLIAGILKRSSWLGLTAGPLSVGCHYRRGELSHTDPHTHWRTHAFRLGGLRDEWAHWGLGLIKWAVARSWCKEILWWDYQSALDGAGPSSAAGRAHWGSISAAAKCCHFNPNINMLAKLEKEASFTYFTNILMYRGLIAFADVNHHRATCPRSKQGSTKTHCLNRRSWQSI